MEVFVNILGAFLICFIKSVVAQSLNVQLRLADGETSYEGRVEIQYNNEWGTICDNVWSQENADVVCKTLGFENKSIVFKKSFVAGKGKIWLADVRCFGEETSIAECYHRKWGINNCGHNQDVGVVCKPIGSPNIDVRLSQPGGNMGIVEIQYYGQWKTICDSNLDMRDARVVCKMLGFSEASAVLKGFTDSSVTRFSDVDCRGTESDISECRNLNWGQGSCGKYNKSGVLCKSGSSSLTPRLTGGSVSHEGFIQVKYFGSWEYLSYQYFNMKYANIICRMKGYDEAVTFYPKRGQITRTSVYFSTNICNDEETSIENCKDLHIIRRSTANWHELSWIICKIRSADPKVRLRKGGTVEIQLYGIWGHICAHGWDFKDAQVTCRMLNYKGAILADKISGSTTYPVLLSPLKCRGDEKDLLDCSPRFSQRNVCNGGWYATAACHNSSDSKFVHVRIGAAGSMTNFGRVEINYQGNWIPVCDDKWDIFDSHVVCRMLGYKAAMAGIRGFRGVASDVFWVSGVECHGNEAIISECYHNGWKSRCPTLLQAGVMCQNDKEPIPLQVRLEDSVSPHSGRVGVRFGGIWGSICNKDFNNNDAMVLCRMLGYVSFDRIYKSPGNLNSTIWLSRLGCNGMESSIENCSHSEWGQTGSCSHLDDVAVTCKAADAPLIQIDDSNSVTSTISLVNVTNSMGKVDKRLQSTMQIIIQKAPENFIFDPRNLPPVPSVNVTMATKNDVNTYIAADMPFPLSNRSTIGNLSNQFVIGDGGRYGSYHNAPLHPGTLYIVYARIVTRSLTGDFVYGEAAILIFKTAISKLKAVSDNDGLLQIPKNLVIGVAVGVALFALIFVSCCLCTKSKRKRKSTRKRVATRGVQGYELQTRTTHEPYQELIRHPQQQQQQQQPLVEDGNIYMNSSCGNGHLYANDMAHSKLYRTDDVVYSNAAH